MTVLAFPTRGHLSVDNVCEELCVRAGYGGAQREAHGQDWHNIALARHRMANSHQGPTSRVHPKGVKHVAQVELAHRRPWAHGLNDVADGREPKRDCLTRPVETRRGLVDHWPVLEPGLLQCRRLHDHHDPTLDPRNRADGQQPLKELVELTGRHKNEVTGSVHDLVRAFRVMRKGRVHDEIHTFRPFHDLLPRHPQLLAAQLVDLVAAVIPRRPHMLQLRYLEPLRLFQHASELSVHAVEVLQVPSDTQVIPSVAVEGDHYCRTPLLG
eukprot:3936394-Rhodomonas_salina.2